MENSKEGTTTDGPVRTTRSGRTIKPPTTPSSLTLKVTGRKKKKVVMMEVEVSDEEEAREETDNSVTEDPKDVQEPGLSLELENSDNAVEASDQFIQANDNSDFDNCSNTAQFPEESNNVNDTEISSFEGAILACENDAIDNSMVVVENEFVGGELGSNVVKTESLKLKGLDGKNVSQVGIVDEFSLGEANSGTSESLEESTKNLQVLEPMDTTDDTALEGLANQTESISTIDEAKLLDDISQNGSSDKINENGAPDTEVISEDELPGVQVAKVPETEEVSDEELPGPKRAELPADTEVVSEDELPTVKKEGTKRKLTEGDYDPGSPTSENENPTKKQTLETDVEKEKDEKVKPKKLPELDKYWKAVNDDPTDFTGWTYLLQYVDQENDMEAAREAYDAFLSHYPYCYGYWRKYADYEKRKGNKKKCEEVFERGLKAIPLSVDLWIHYLTYVRTSRPDDEEYIRSQFERAIAACGLEFRSDRLWDSYIKWETEGKYLQHVTALYDRLLATPTQGYTTHFDNFQEHIASHPPNKVLDVDEFLTLRKEVKQLLKQEAEKTAEAETENPDDVPPGEDDNKETVSSDEEVKGIRERIVSVRRKVHKNTVNAVTVRWNYEEAIKRPYFHVKPLERCQLKNWQDYLDFEIAEGEQTRIIVLFERCLIACALYEEFWLRYVLYLEALKDPEMLQRIKDTYERACTIHHLKKPNLHTQWAMFEESIQNFERAAEILVNLEKSLPNLLQVAFRRINLERRRGENEKCCQLYEHYINNVKNKVVGSNLSIKYARFCHKIMKNIDKAIEVLKTAVTKDTNNARLYLQLIDLVLQKENSTETDVLVHMDAFLQKEGIENEQKLLFAQRKLEYLEDFSTTVEGIQKAQEEYQKYLKLVKETAPKKKESTKTKKEKNPPLPSAQSNSYGNYGNYTNSGASSNNYNQYPPSQQGQYNYSQYGQGDQYNYQNWQYQQGGYGGYNQWSGYSGGYGY